MVHDSEEESQETPSSLEEDALNISFESITYEVRSGILGRGHKTILSGLSGSFNAGELTIVMGQSGAGKSSLMDILAGYTEPSSGKVLVNGHVCNSKTFRRRSCYILQDDKVQDMLSIEESLSFAAELKLGNHISSEQKRRRIEEIITSLKLNRARNTLARFLSGGEKKRLAIGLELVSDPLVMFLDEPTSGLDSSISKNMVCLLHSLARQGRTMVATIHQPSAKLLRLVDRLYAIVGGRCAYIGSVPMLHQFLEQIDMPCPPYHNVVDFLIEASGEGQTANDLVSLSQNGKETHFNESFMESAGCSKVVTNYEPDSPDNVFLTTLPPPKEDQTNKILLKLKSTYSTSFWKQFTILLKRSLLLTWREPQFSLLIIGIHCAMAAFVGLLFYNVATDAKYARDNVSSLFFGLMFLMFTAFNSVTVTYPKQFPVVRREHFNRWYMTEAYYFSTLISSLPLQTICTLLYGIITYLLTGQPHDFIRFIIYCWTQMSVSYIALLFGLMNGFIFNVKFQNGVIFGPFFIMPFVIFSGFFLLYSDAPVFFRWLFHISFLKHGLVAIAVGMFGMDRPKLYCSDIICRYRYPKQILIDRELVDEPLWIALLALVCVSIVLKVITYVILKINLRNKPIKSFKCSSS